MSAENSQNLAGDGPRGAIIYEFGPFVLNATERILTRDGDKLHLKPKTFDLLVFLVERANTVAPKEEIFEAVWKEAFVEDANLAVHISALRKIFANDGEEGVSIETVPKIDYRLKADVNKEDATQVRRREETDGTASTADAQEAPETAGPEINAGFGPKRLMLAVLALAVGPILVTAGVLIWQYRWANGLKVASKPINRVDPLSWNRVECPRGSADSDSVIGGCEDAVAVFSIASNPNGNWSYGYTPKDSWSDFHLFDQPGHNNHFASPGLPADTWTPSGQWHPVILRNTSNAVIMIQNVVMVPPSMFEMHPGPNGERCVLRWIAPADGFYRFQGQFRGININGDTYSDFRIVKDGVPTTIWDDVIGFNFPKPFDITLPLAKSETVDFSVGYGKNEVYEGDSTGFSVIVSRTASETTEGN